MFSQMIGDKSVVNVGSFDTFPNVTPTKRYKVYNIEYRFSPYGGIKIIFNIMQSPYMKLKVCIIWLYRLIIMCLAL